VGGSARVIPQSPTAASAARIDIPREANFVLTNILENACMVALTTALSTPKS
jgi:hypothetical protein